MSGLVITGNNDTIRGLQINDYAHGDGIKLSGASATSDAISGDFLTANGYDVAGCGAEIAGASGDVVGSMIGGGVPEAPTPADRDVLSGYQPDGVCIDQGAQSDLVENSYIGPGASGLSTSGFGYGNLNSGVLIGGPANGGNTTANIIGGTTPGSGNLISGNQIGVSLSRDRVSRGTPSRATTSARTPPGPPHYKTAPTASPSRAMRRETTSASPAPEMS